MVVSSTYRRLHVVDLNLRSLTRTSRLSRICSELSDVKHPGFIADVLLWSPLTYFSMSLRHLCGGRERATRFSVVRGNRKYVRMELPVPVHGLAMRTVTQCARFS
jgi:hypothetical protein